MAINGIHVGCCSWGTWIALICVFTISEFNIVIAVTGDLTVQTLFQFHDQNSGKNPPNYQPPFAIPNSNQRPEIVYPAINMTCDNRTRPINSSDVHLLVFGTRHVKGRQIALGTCLFDHPIQLLEQPRLQCRVPKSFGTMFEVHTYYDKNPPSDWSSIQSGDKGLAFIMSSLEPSSINSLDFSNSLSIVFYFTGGFLNFQIVARYNDSSSVIQDSPLMFRPSSPLPQCSLDHRKIYLLKTCNIVGRAKFTVWIEYFSSIQVLSVKVGDIVSKPKPAFYSVGSNTSLDEYLTRIFRGKNGDERMFVGFSSWDILKLPGTVNNTSNGSLSYEIDDWTFNSDGPPPDYPRNFDGGYSAYWLRQKRLRKRARKVLIVSTTVPSTLVCIFLSSVIYALYQRNARLHALAKKYNIVDLESLGRGAQRFSFKELSVATKGFSSSELLGSGGFGKVYRGTLLLKDSSKHKSVAVKRISSNSEQGAREFETEVTIIGQVQHRNLVRVLGWCHERGELLLVYELMPNGSLDQHLFNRMKRNVETPQDTSTTVTLTWERRVNIVSGVALALAYLHEEWEQRVIHRDVKCSNIMLDTDFNARLGDFGLARSSDHGKPTEITALAGTHGYLAPELGHTFKATVKTDVYSFGAVVLEVATGKKASLPIYDSRVPEDVALVDYVWFLYRKGKLLEAADGTLGKAFDRAEMVRLLKIGLLCSHPDPASRPRMREVMSILRGEIPFPSLPSSKPVPVFMSSFNVRGDDNESDETDCGWPLIIPPNEEGDKTVASRAFESEPKLFLRIFRSQSAPPLHTL